MPRSPRPRGWTRGIETFGLACVLLALTPDLAAAATARDDVPVRVTVIRACVVRVTGAAQALTWVCGRTAQPEQRGPSEQDVFRFAGTPPPTPRLAIRRESASEGPSPAHGGVVVTIDY